MTAQVLQRIEPVIAEQRPDVVAVVGDVNSTLAAALWTGDDVSYHGDHFRADARFSLVPVQRPHPPVWIACSWPKRAGPTDR